MNSKTIGNILKKESHYPLYFTCSLLLLLLVNGLGIITPMLYENIIDVYLPQQNISQILWSCAFMVAIPFTCTFLDTFYTYFAFVKVKELAFKIKCQLFEKLLNQPMPFFKEHDSGQLAGYLGIDVMDFFYYWIHDLPGVVCSWIIAIIVLILLFRMSPLITIVMGLAIPLTIIPGSITGKWLNRLSTQLNEFNVTINSKITESFKAIKFMKSQNCVQQRIKELNEIHDENLKVFGKAIVSENITITISKGLVGPLFTGIAFILCSFQVLQGKMSIGTLIAFTAYLPTLFAQFTVIVNNGVHIQKQKGLQSQNFKFLEMDDEFTNDLQTNLPFTDLGSITFNHLSFAYEDRPVIQDLSLSIKSGELVTIIGESGCGKSTLLDILLKFNLVEDGMVSLGDYDINQYPIKTLRQQIALVSQEIQLLKGSLRYNMRLANPLATDQELLEAIEQAQLSELIARLPRGLDTDLSEDAKNLSGGERQRLSLALALVRRPKILLLDEVSANLDLESEARILDMIEDLAKARHITVILVTHRRSFIKPYFRVISLQNGKISFDGTYDEFVA